MRTARARDALAVLQGSRAGGEAARVQVLRGAQCSRLWCS